VCLCLRTLGTEARVPPFTLREAAVLWPRQTPGRMGYTPNPQRTVWVFYFHETTEARLLPIGAANGGREAAPVAHRGGIPGVRFPH